MLNVIALFPFYTMMYITGNVTQTCFDLPKFVVASATENNTGKIAALHLILFFYKLPETVSSLLSATLSSNIY